ncbi:MAG: hypothetical protein NTW67_05105 [Candidatus Woesearchaeota archaeon]|nr:hypothetical protein [Candidatus Woesearchaeota archaeon]
MQIKNENKVFKEIPIEELYAFAKAGGSFDFLLEDEDLYTEEDIIEPA